MSVQNYQRDSRVFKIPSRSESINKFRMSQSGLRSVLVWLGVGGMDSGILRLLYVTCIFSAFLTLHRLKIGMYSCPSGAPGPFP